MICWRSFQTIKIFRWPKHCRLVWAANRFRSMELSVCPTVRQDSEKRVPLFSPHLFHWTLCSHLISSLELFVLTSSLHWNSLFSPHLSLRTLCSHLISSSELFVLTSSLPQNSLFLISSRLAKKLMGWRDLRPGHCGSASNSSLIKYNRNNTKEIQSSIIIHLFMIYFFYSTNSLPIEHYWESKEVCSKNTYF